MKDKALSEYKGDRTFRRSRPPTPNIKAAVRHQSQRQLQSSNLIRISELRVDDIAVLTMLSSRAPGSRARGCGRAPHP
jgi:hypothetical protein